MFSPIRTCWAVVALAGWVWNPASAQEAMNPLGLEGADSAPGMYVELRSLQDRMGKLGNLALEESPELAKRWQSFQAALERAMTEIDPDADDDLERLAGTRGELEQAWADRDVDRLQRLLDERRRLRASLESAQAEALRREDVAAEMTAFRTALVARMRESNPDLDALMARMESLAHGLRSLPPGTAPPTGSREAGGAREPSDRR